MTRLHRTQGTVCRLSRPITAKVVILAKASLRAASAKRWTARNVAAIRAYNTMIDAQGVFSEGLRTF